MTDLVLYDAPNSPCARRVRMCLLEKEIDFEIRWMSLGVMDQKQAWYLELNPNGLVPTLVHDGRALYESNVINEYLDAVFPDPKLVPEDPYLQAQMRMWMAFELDWAKPFRDAIYETLGKSRLKDTGVTPDDLKDAIGKRTDNPYYLKFALKVLTEPKDDALVADRHAVLLEKMALMEARLSDGREWLLGDRFSLADIALGPRTDMFPIIDLPDLYDRFPNIGGFMARLKDRPSWQQSAITPDAGEERRQVRAAA